MATCNSCGRDNQDLYKFCLGCGAELGAGGESKAKPKRTDETPAPKVIEDLPSGNGRHASKTLEDAEWDLRDRRDSLAHIEPIPALGIEPSPGDVSLSGKMTAARLCPTCGNAVPAEFSFCGQCGSRLDAKSGAVSTGAPAPSATQKSGPSSSSAVHGRLILIRPDGTEGGVHPLDEGENVIGRGMGPLFDADGYLSPRHAEIVLNAAGVVVRDTGSLNGVFVKLTDEEPIVDGDVFRIGQELLRFDEIPAPVPLDDGTDIMGSPNPGYWGRLALIVGRDHDGSAFPLFGDAVTLGRERGDILFPEDGYVSGSHARVSMRNNRFYLADLGSSNGTFLRVRGERSLPTGSAILMGQQLFRITY